MRAPPGVARFREASEAVRAGRPATDEQAEAMLRIELRERGVEDLSDEAIATSAPLARKPPVIAGMLAAKTVLSSYRRLWRRVSDLAEPDWLTPLADARPLEPGLDEVARTSDVVLDPAALAFLERIEYERPHSDDGHVPLFAWMDGEGTGDQLAVMVGQTRIGYLVGGDAEAARHSLAIANCALWTVASLSRNDEHLPRIRVRIACSSG